MIFISVPILTDNFGYAHGNKTFMLEYDIPYLLELEYDIPYLLEYINYEKCQCFLITVEKFRRI